MSEQRDIVERLRAEAAEVVDWNGETMKTWDKIRSLCAERDGSDLPRLMFEGIAERLAENMTEAADEIASLRAQIASARKALEPFAKIVQYINDKCHDSRPLVYGVESCHAAQLTVGDFRRAAASYTDEQRSSFGQFCSRCGGTDPECYICGTTAQKTEQGEQK